MKYGIEENYMALWLAIVSPVDITPETAFLILDGKAVYGAKPPRKGRPKGSINRSVLSGK